MILLILFWISLALAMGIYVGMQIAFWTVREAARRGYINIKDNMVCEHGNRSLDCRLCKHIAEIADRYNIPKDMLEIRK